MALLTILEHPDPRLRIRAREVTAFDDALQRLIDDMFETMYAAPGVGLAATQVGVDLRVATMDCSEKRDAPITMINPRITQAEDPELLDEACLSVPGVGERVRRFRRVRLEAMDRHGKPFTLDAEGLLAQCIQHEIDHLDGKLYLDHLSAIKRERLLRRFNRERDRRGAR